MTLFANTFGELFVRSLAVLGGAVLGGWLAGWLLGSIQHNYFKDQKIPGYAFWAARAASFVLFGVVTFLLVFSSGGWGLGGGGGLNVGGDSQKETPKKEGKPPPKEGAKETPGKLGGGVLRVEVLGDEPLEKLNKGGAADPNKRYRVSREGTPMTIEDLIKVVQARRNSKEGLLRVEIVVYQDSPVPERPQVAGLKARLGDLDPSLKIDILLPDRYAPVD